MTQNQMRELLITLIDEKTSIEYLSSVSDYNNHLGLNCQCLKIIHKMHANFEIVCNPHFTKHP